MGKMVATVTARRGLNGRPLRTETGRHLIPSVDPVCGRYAALNTPKVKFINTGVHPYRGGSDTTLPLRDNC